MERVTIRKVEGLEGRSGGGAGSFTRRKVANTPKMLEPAVSASFPNPSQSNLGFKVKGLGTLARCEFWEDGGLGFRTRQINRTLRYL